MDEQLVIGTRKRPGSAVLKTTTHDTKLALWMSMAVLPPEGSTTRNALIDAVLAEGLQESGHPDARWSDAPAYDGWRNADHDQAVDALMSRDLDLDEETLDDDLLVDLFADL